MHSAIPRVFLRGEQAKCKGSFKAGISTAADVSALFLCQNLLCCLAHLHASELPSPQTDFIYWHISSFNVLPGFLCMCAVTVCVRTCVAELTGHQSSCGKWKRCSGGEMPEGRLGINTRICDALWSAHLRGKKEEADRKGTSAGTKSKYKEAFFKPLWSWIFNWPDRKPSSKCRVAFSEDSAWCQPATPSTSHTSTYVPKDTHTKTLNQESYKVDL